MKVLIVGAGRMGTRHLQGVLKVKKITRITVLDVKQSSLNNAEQVVGNDLRITYTLLSDFRVSPFDVCIIATTANDRENICNLAAAGNCKEVMIEKPLGQSYDAVEKLVTVLKKYPFRTVVNLNMRMYESIKKLKYDLEFIPQMQGIKNITLNTGTIGIGCNGIHYLDFFEFILCANDAKLVSAEIDTNLIPSGRGSEFCDFGGWAVIKYYRDDLLIANAFLSMSARSTVFGDWEIVAPFGRITIDEFSQTRYTLLRNGNSKKPLSFYAADYLPAQQEPFVSPFLGDLTAQWIEGVLNGINYLPEIQESLNTHKLLFNWLSYSETHKEIYPIT
jgi:predicted dehydrogenase